MTHTESDHGRLVARKYGEQTGSNHRCLVATFRTEDLMSDSNLQIVSLKVAAESFGALEILKFRDSVKRLGCLFKVAGLEFVDQTKFEVIVTEKAQDAAKAAEKRAGSRRSPAQQIGLYMARLKLYPTWIADKEAAIVDAQHELEAASTNYAKSKAIRRLSTLKADLERMQRNCKRDQDRLDVILNSDIGIETPGETVETLPNHEASQIVEEA